MIGYVISARIPLESETTDEDKLMNILVMPIEDLEDEELVLKQTRDHKVNLETEPGPLDEETRMNRWYGRTICNLDHCCQDCGMLLQKLTIISAHYLMRIQEIVILEVAILEVVIVPEAMNLEAVIPTMLFREQEVRETMKIVRIPTGIEMETEITTCRWRVSDFLEEEMLMQATH